MLRFNYCKEFLKLKDFIIYKFDIEREISAFITKYAEDCIEDIKFISIVPKNKFKDDEIFAKAIIETGVIELPYECIYDYFFDKSRNISSSDDFNYKHECLFNSLCHEVQHFINKRKYHEFFELVEEKSFNTLEKTLLIKFFDEYMATYLSIKLIFFEGFKGMVDKFKKICSSKDALIENNVSDKSSYFSDDIRKQDYLVSLIETYAYATGFCCATAERGISSYDLELFGFECDSKFSNILKNLKGLIEQYNVKNNELFIQSCCKEINNLFRLLDFSNEYLDNI